MSNELFNLPIQLDTVAVFLFKLCVNKPWSCKVLYVCLYVCLSHFALIGCWMYDVMSFGIPNGVRGTTSVIKIYKTRWLVKDILLLVYVNLFWLIISMYIK